MLLWSQQDQRGSAECRGNAPFTKKNFAWPGRLSMIGMLGRVRREKKEGWEHTGPLDTIMTCRWDNT